MSFGDTHCPDDEPARRGADEVERVTRDQRQRRRRGGVQHRDIVRVDDPRSLDPIDVLAVQRVDLYGVTDRDVLQSPEEAVAVAGDAEVPIRSRWRGTLDV